MYGLGSSLFYMHVYRMYRHFAPPPNTFINTQLQRVHVYVTQSEYESMYGFESILNACIYRMYRHFAPPPNTFINTQLQRVHVYVTQSEYESMYGFESILHACIYRMYTHTHNDLTCYR